MFNSFQFNTIQFNSVAVFIGRIIGRGIYVETARIVPQVTINRKDGPQIGI